MEQQGTGKRKLAAILSADVAGYSRLMGEDEHATVHRLTAYRAVFADSITQHAGRVVDTAGDSALAEFASVVEAVSRSTAGARDAGVVEQRDWSWSA
jgi:class 3 adenylate cyclase